MKSVFILSSILVFRQEVIRVINKDMTIGEVVENYPASVEVFMQYGMGCLGCPATRFETIEQGAEAHVIDLEDLINDLNKAVSKK